MRAITGLFEWSSKMGVTFLPHGKKAAEPEAPVWALLLALANNLNKDTSAEAIGDLLSQAAKAALAPVAKEKFLKTVRDQTGVSVSALKKQLAAHEMRLMGGPRDNALFLARAVLDKAFKNRIT